MEWVYVPIPPLFKKNRRDFIRLLTDSRTLPDRWRTITYVRITPEDYTLNWRSIQQRGVKVIYRVRPHHG